MTPKRPDQKSVPIIRSAVESDLKVLVNNLTPFPNRPQLSNRFAEQKSGIRLLLVLELEGAPVGTVSISPEADSDGRTRRLFALDIGTRFRRRGFASLLMSEVERLVVADGHSAVRLDVAVENSGAIHLYAKLGYTKFGSPQKLTWTRGVDGHPSEEVTEISYLMRKDLEH